MRQPLSPLRLPRFVLALLLLAGLGLIPRLGRGTEVPIRALRGEPDRYHQREVTIRGTAIAVQPHLSRRGHEYLTFLIQDPFGAAVKVFAWGRPAVRTGQRVVVTGTFWRVKRVGRYTFMHEVEARRVEVLPASPRGKRGSRRLSGQKDGRVPGRDVIPLPPLASRSRPALPGLCFAKALEHLGAHGGFFTRGGR